MGKLLDTISKFIVKDLSKKKLNVLDIKFFGSRITGNPRKDSDLDAAIQIENIPEWLIKSDSIIYLKFKNLILELHFFEEELNFSWLQNSIKGKIHVI